MVFIIEKLPIGYKQIMTSPMLLICVNVALKTIILLWNYVAKKFFLAFLFDMYIHLPIIHIDK